MTNDQSQLQPRYFDSIIFDLAGTLWNASGATAVAWQQKQRILELK